ncbi:MAG: glycosyltransferase family 2 protein [Candidatus Nanoarchaeia archaeon]
MKEKATLVILNYNEIEGLKALFDKIPIKDFDEVFAVDPGSTDGSVEFLKSKGIPVIHQDIRGRGEAFRIAVRNARNENVIFFSPDGNENPYDLPKLVYWLKDGYDMVIASRFMVGGRADDSDIPFPIRGIGNKVFTEIANILWHGYLTDSINGFRAVKKNKFFELNPDAHGFGIEYQMSIRALKLRHRIKEIPTFEGDRIGGKSTAHTFRTGWLFLKLVLRELWIGKKFQQKSL